MVLNMVSGVARRRRYGEGDRKGRPYGRRWVLGGGGQIDWGVIICHFHN